MCLLLFTCINAGLSAQDNRIFFSNLGVNDGLSGNGIMSICEDTRGFVWFGTSSGLNRFDGYKFEVFRTDPADSLTISDNSINLITSDSDGDIWIATRVGISVLDHDQFTFHRIVLQAAPPLSCLDVNYVTALAAGKDNNFIAGTHNGLFIINHADYSLKHILPDESSCASELNNITSVVCGKDGSFWAATVNGFIYRYDQDYNSVERLEPIRSNGESPGGETRLFIDRDDRLWIANKNGLYLYNIQLKTWDNVFKEFAGCTFRKMQVTGIDQDHDGRIWITTDGSGVFCFEKETAKPLNITSLPYLKGSLASNGLTSLCCGRSGIIWIGNSKKGVDFYRKDVRKFRTFRNYPTDVNSLSNNDVNCITEDHNGNIWIGTNGGGLNCYNRKTNTFRHYSTANGLSTDIIVSVYEDSGRRLWIGTYLGGLNCLDPASGKVRVFRHDDIDSTTISDDRVWDICEDSHNNLWIATLTGGLNLLNPSTGIFRRYNSGNSPVCFDYLNHISRDKNDCLWLSSANGLIFFDNRNNRSECFYSVPGTAGSLSDNRIISTFTDSRGLFWVCTSNGLNLMNRKSGTFRVFREADGLPSASVLRILEDRDSVLWISTKNGISRLKIGGAAEYDSITFSFQNFGINDGLQGKEFNETAACAAAGGEMWFGGADGLNAFLPSEIRNDSTPAKLVITGFRVDNIPVHYRQVFNNRVLLEKPIFNVDKVTLRYIENSFTIDFAALNYFFPGKNMYAYNLEGFNEKWILTEGQENYATFSNLDNGNYTFRLKGTNSDGIWSDIPVTLSIRILPPFWKSWYAYMIYVILILSVLLLLRYLTLTRERMKMQLEQEKLESQHTHEIDQLKLKFFTNISHEFRTPLSLIISPAEKLRAVMKDQPGEKYLNIINQNARRLLFMVNQLLDFRKMEVQGFGFNPSLGNIISFLGDAVSAFSDLAEQKRIKLSFTSAISDLVTIFDRDKLEKVIFNLLSNALKFTHAGGEVKVTAEVLCEEENDSYVEGRRSNLIIKVHDTGIGVPANKKGGLFSSYYQVENGIPGGTGIGLSLVKEFVRLHDGDISVESEPGRGSCFTIIFPVKTEIPCSGNETIPGELLSRPVPDEVAVITRLEGAEKPSVLIAEDDGDLRFYLKDNLKDRYNVYEASNGTDAFEMVSQILPDLVITDIKMPGMEGTELCRRIKSDNTICHIPVILLTARSREDEQCADLVSGADDYMSKPFNFQLLEARIANLISQRKKLRKAFSSNLKIEPSDIAITSLDEQFIRRALELVEKNLAKTDYTVEELSRDMGLSRTLLYKKVLSLTGKAPHEFIRSLRLKRAAQLLQKSQLNVSEVAFRVGFNDPKYFRKHFRNEFGVLPSKYPGLSENGQ